MRNSGYGAALAAVLAFAAAAPGQGLEAVPDSVSVAFKPASRPFDTVLLTNTTQAPIRVDSILIRFLDGGANPKPSDFIACKDCAPENPAAYLYGGWMYGASTAQSLRYLRDSLFLIQDSRGVPVALEIGAGASMPFGLEFPVNCPICGRMPSYPGATRYAFTFIASDGSRAELSLAVSHPTSVMRPGLFTESPARAKPRDAAGRARRESGRAILFR